jgi:predicted RNA-binding Zn-ribbon protein involved in translation (DUF1610 family)
MMEPRLVSEDLVFNCLMCGTPLLIREQDRDERLQCPVCGEIMLSTDSGMAPDPGEEYESPSSGHWYQLFEYGPMRLVLLLIVGVIVLGLLLAAHR